MRHISFFSALVPCMHMPGTEIFLENFHRCQSILHDVKNLISSTNFNTENTQGCAEIMVYCHLHLNILQCMNKDGSIKKNVKILAKKEKDLYKELYAFDSALPNSLV